METIDRLCCNCIHYLHGQLESPCAKGMSKVGYLQPGCWRWQSEKEEKKMPTKRCCICGEIKEIDKFTHAKGEAQDYCKACRLKYRESKKRNKED